MIKLHLKSNIDLRQAETVTVAFYKDDKILLTKTGEDLTIMQSRVDLKLSADDIALWEPGRYIGIDVKAAYTDGSEIESNYVYRSFDVTQSRTEYWANTYFGDDEPHHSDVVDTSDATLTSGSQMLAPYTAYAKGTKYTGTIQKYGGEIITLPESIAIVQNPTKTVYSYGESIDLSGMVIKGYYKNGDEWGTIPISELTETPATATVYPKNSYGANGVIALRIPVDTPLGSRYRNETALGEIHVHDQYGDWTGYSFFGSNGYGSHPVSQSGNIYLTRHDGKIYGVDGGIGVRQYTSAYEDGQSVYGWGTGAGITDGNIFSGYSSEDSGLFNRVKDKIPVISTTPVGIDFSSPTLLDNEQTITIKWNRVGDGKELSTTLKISGGGD